MKCPFWAGPKYPCLDQTEIGPKTHPKRHGLKIKIKQIIIYKKRKSNKKINKNNKKQ